MLMMDQAARSFSPSTDSELFAILNLHPDVARLGAAGPDMTFFAPDFGQWSVELVEVITGFYDDVIAPIVDFYEDWIEPVVDVLDQVGDGVEAVLDEATCDLVETFSDNLDDIVTRLGGIKDGLILTAFSKSVNVYDAMTPPLQEGDSEENWFWFDYLHNRRTGRFIREMWDLADTDQKKAYVLGYIAHYSGDFVGHEYVNTIVGGAPRAHLARHHFTENIMDVHFYDAFRNEEITNTFLHRRMPHGHDVDELGTLRTVLDQPNDVPDDMRPIFEMIHDAMRVTYDDTPHPKRISSEYLTVENLNTSFWLMLASLKAMTSSYIPPPEFPGAEVLDAVNDAIDDFIDTASNPPSPSSSPPGFCLNFWSSDCDFSLSALEDWLDYLWDTITYLGELLAWIAELIRDLWQVFACTLSAPIKLAIHGAFWLAHKTLHEILMYLREALVLAAFIHPEREWVNASPLAQSFLRVGKDPAVDAREGSYPRRAAQSNEGFQSYPTTPTEEPATVPGPFPYGARATDIVAGLAQNDAIRDAYASASDPAETRQIEFDTIGQSIDAAVPMMSRLMRAIVDGDETQLNDWTMDADRGFGYQNWRLRGPGNPLAWNSSDPVVDDWAE
jgi:hypothetical protein